jgi:hypothetical protein
VPGEVPPFEELIAGTQRCSAVHLEMRGGEPAGLMRCGDARGAGQITSHSMHREADCQANPRRSQRRRTLKANRLPRW